jgi:hypothetical protein
VYVRFAPAATGALTGTLAINETSPAGTQTVSLSGNGVGRVALSTTSLDFGIVSAATGSSSLMMTVTNYTGAPLNMSAPTTDPGFVVSANSCGPVLAPGSNCGIWVRMLPGTVGLITGNLYINDVWGSGTQTVSLSGTLN